MAASQRATSSAWSWVITSRCVPGGSSASTSSGSTGTGCTCTAATASASGAERLVGQVLGPGVDQVQVEVVAGQDAGELETDVADPEDRDRRYHGQRLQQHRHLAAAALDAVLDRRLVGQVALERLGPGPAGREQRPRTAYGLGLEVAAADRPRWSPGGDDHLGAGLARGVAADVGHRDEHAGLAGGAEVGHRLPPRRHTRHRPGAGTAVERPVDRLRRGRRGELDARRRAARTPRTPRAAPRARENASISGGSPTAFEP